MRIETTYGKGPKGDKGDPGIGLTSDGLTMGDHAFIARDNLLKGKTPKTTFSETVEIVDAYKYRPSIAKGYIKNPIEVVVDREELGSNPIEEGNSIIISGTLGEDEKVVKYIFPVYSGDFTSGFKFQHIKSVKAANQDIFYTLTYPNTFTFNSVVTAERLEIDGIIGDLCWDTVETVTALEEIPRTLSFVFAVNTVAFTTEITSSTILKVCGTLKTGQSVSMYIDNFTGSFLFLNQYISNVTKVSTIGDNPEELGSSYSNGIVTLDAAIENPTTLSFIGVSCGMNFMLTVTDFVGTTLITGIRCLYIEELFNSDEVTVAIEDLNIVIQEQGKYLIANEDYEFCEDRQIFYFLKKITGYVLTTGTVFYNGVSSGIATREALLYPQSSYKVDLGIDNVLEFSGNSKLYFNHLAKDKTSVLAETPLSAKHMYVTSELSTNDCVIFDFPNLPAVGEVTFGDWWVTEDKLKINGEETEFSISSAAYKLIVDNLLDSEILEVRGFVNNEAFLGNITNFSGDKLIFNVPWYSVDTVKVNNVAVEFLHESTILTLSEPVINASDLMIIGKLDVTTNFTFLFSNFEGVSIDTLDFIIDISSVVIPGTPPTELETTEIKAVVFDNITEDSVVNFEGTMSWDKEIPAGTRTSVISELEDFTGFNISIPEDWNTVDYVRVNDTPAWYIISLNAFELTEPVVSKTVTVYGTIPQAGENPAISFIFPGFSGSTVCLDNFWSGLSSIKINGKEAYCKVVGKEILFKVPVVDYSTLQLTGTLLDGTAVIYTREKFIGTKVVLPTVYSKNDFNVTHISIDNVDVEFTENQSTILINPITVASSVTITGTKITKETTIIPSTVNMSYRVNSHTGSYIVLPESMQTVTYTFLEDVLGIKGNSAYFFCMYEDPKLYFGTNVPLDGKGPIVISGIKNNKSVIFSYSNFYGNVPQLPIYVDEISKVTLGEPVDGIITYNDIPVIFDYNTQRVSFAKNISGILSFSSDSYYYTGLAAGGEELKIIKELEGIMATTCGTGEHLSALTSQGRNWTEWNRKTLGKDLTVITDYDSVVIYKDERPGGGLMVHNGFTSKEMYPLTLKLPLSPYVDDMRRDDKAFINLAFTPDINFKYLSSTYSCLDDTARVSEGSLEPNSMVRMSTEQSVRGVKGVQTIGRLPVYYGGAVDPLIFISTYKWFAVEVTNANNNDAITVGSNYLLCVQNTSYGGKTLSCQLANGAPNVSADLFSIDDLMGEESV